MNLLQLEYFCKVADSATLTKAAEELYISQPALSAMIHKLEDEVGGKLFDRDSRSLRLNSRGQILLHYATRILQDMDALQNEMHLLNNAQQILTVKLGAASHVLLPLINQFQKKYPQLQIQLIQNQFDEDISVKKADIIITSDWKKISKGTLLLEEDLVLAVPQNSSLANKSAITVEDLKKETFVMFSHVKSLRRIVDHYCKVLGFSPKIGIVSDEVETVKTLIRLEMGIAMIPSISWSAYELHNIRRLSLAPYACKRYIYLIDNTATENPITEDFVHTVKNAMKQLRQEYITAELNFSL